MAQLKTVKIVFTAEIAENAEKERLFSRLAGKNNYKHAGFAPRWIVLCGLCVLCG